MRLKKRKLVLYCIFTLVILANFSLWLFARDKKAEWANVPPVPSYQQAGFMSLADPQMTYRTIALMLQNLGSVGGDIRNLDEYNYDALKEWFDLSVKLDPQAKSVPYLAAYFYSSLPTKEKYRPIMPFLYFAHNLPSEGSWRWLAQGAYFAKHQLHDDALALMFADKLASLDRPNMPIWTKQMSIFVRNDQGDKQAAYDLMKAMLLSSLDTAPAQEIFVMREYICTKILDEVDAKTDPICKTYEEEKEQLE